MAKAANVEIIKRVSIGGGLCTTVVRGDVEACGRRSKPAPRQPPKSASSFPAT